MIRISVVGTILALIASDVVASPSPTTGALPSATPAPPQPTPRPRANPYRGEIISVDQKARTFSIRGREKERVFKVTTRTRLWRGETKADFRDLVTGEQVYGSFWKNEDGTLEAKTVRLPVGKPATP